MAIKLEFDIAGNPELPVLILAKRNGDKLGKIEAQNLTLADHLNSAAEMQFSVNKYIDGELNNLWYEITNFRLIWCEGWDTWFEITVELDEADETVKTVSCTELGEAELSQINLYNIEINTETDIARSDYIQPTVLYNPEVPSASLLHRIMEKAPHYTVIHVDETISNIQRSYTFDSISLYDAFQEIAEEVGCLFVFGSGSDSGGRPERSISVYDLESNCVTCGYRGEFTSTCPECGGTDINEGYGTDTTIFVSADGLGEDVQFTTDTDSVKNCFRLEGGDDLMTATIINCNPNGTAYLWHFTDDMKKDMSDELAFGLDAYGALYTYYQNTYKAAVPSELLSEYNALVEKYQTYDSSLECLGSSIIGYPALMNAYYNAVDFAIYLQSSLMPDASLSDTSASEEASLLTAAALSPVAVANIASISLSTANSAVLAMAKVIVDSRYQVKVSESSLSGETWTGSFVITNYSDEEDTATSGSVSIEISGNYEEYLRQLIKKELNGDDSEDLSITGLFAKDYEDFCSELGKYCLDSLTTFYDSCQACLDILIEQGVADGETWSGADPNLYDDLYTPYYEKLGAIEEEIALRESEIALITGDYDTEGSIVTYGLQTYLDEERAIIQKALDFESYIGEDLWLELCAFRREDTYSNSNYISDGLNNAELFSTAREFLSVAEKEIYKSSEQQHSIQATLKNLLVIKEFDPLLAYFETGNWIRVLVDDEVYKLRLIGYEIDFDSLDTLSVEFSDVTAIANGLSDLQSIVDQASSMATSYAAVQSQASQGSSSSAIVNNWRANGLDVTNTKIIAGAENQSQSWDSHGMLFRKYNPLTDSYEPTQSKIINSTYAITDDNWKTIRTAIGNFYYVDPKTGELTSAYGINGEVIIGNLILGESLGIYTADNSMTFDENGLVIDTSGGAAFTITNGSNVQFYIDADGNVVLDNGASITWGNIDVTDLLLSSGNVIVTSEDGSTSDILTYINTEYLTAEYITANCIDVQALTAELIETESLKAAIAEISKLEAETIVADYATIENLKSVSAIVDTLDASVANISSLLAGNAGIGDLQAINLSSANVIIADATITSAMIADLTADKITSGSIYTSKVTIQTGENDESLLFTGSLIQMSDDNVVRFQAGKDASGEYNIYICNADGNVTWDALGLTEAGLTGNGAIVKDAAVAEDANIQGYKLDIASVASCLTDDGSLVVDASKVNINGSTLSAEYTTITQSIATIESDAISSTTTYYALGASNEEPPSDPSSDDRLVSSIVGEAVVDGTAVGVMDWTTERLTAGEGSYLWIAYHIEYIDGSDAWTTPTCITDGYVRSNITTLVTSFEVISGQVSSKVWMSDIEEATDPLGEQVTTLTDKYSEIVQTEEAVTARVAELETTSTSHESRISTLEISADKIATSISEITSQIDSSLSGVEILYALSESATEAPSDGWQNPALEWVDGMYMWQKTITTYTSGDTEETVTCISGATGASGTDGERGTSILKIKTAPTSYTTTTGGYTPQYRISLATVQSQSGATEVLVGDILEYSYYHYPVGYIDETSSPPYVYLGTRTSIRGATGATGATGAAGADGEDGVGISSIVPQYYLSSSSEECVDGEWADEQPEWQSGYYLWTRSYITWTDGSTSTTTPVLAGALNSANEKVTELETTLEQTASEIRASVESLETSGADTSETVAQLLISLGELQAYVETVEQTASDDNDAIYEKLSSLISQTAEQIDITFNSVTEVSNDLASYQEELATYIRLSGDGVEIGKSDSDYSALLSNDRLEFRESGEVVAYITDSTMYITTLEVTESAWIACFEFKQRSNGHGILRYRKRS